MPWAFNPFTGNLDKAEAGQPPVVAPGPPPSLRDSRRVYVALHGSDTNNGTSPAEPLRTLAAAAAAATPGDVVFVGPGTFAESTPIRWRYDVTVFGSGLRSTIVQPAAGQEFNDIFKVDSGFWCWGISFAGHQADETRQAWAISFDNLADNTARGAAGLGAYILKSPYIQNCTSITAEDDAGLAGSVSTGNTGGGIRVNGTACAVNSPIRSMVVDSYTQVNLGGPGCLVENDGYAQLVSFFGTFCTYHVKTLSGGQVNLSGGGTTDFGIEGLVADGYSPTPLYTGSARVAAYGASRLQKTVTIDVSTDVFGCTAHSLSSGDLITFSAVQGSLPTGLAAATTYYVIASGLAADAFKVSATLGGASIDMSGTATGTYQFVRQGDTQVDVVSLTGNRLGSASRPNPGQLLFPQLVFPRNATTGAAEAKTFAYTRTGNFTLTYTEAASPSGPEHEYVSGGSATIGGTNYGVVNAIYNKTTGVVTLTTVTQLPAGNGNVTVSGLQFICPTSAYIVTSSIPINSSGVEVANDSGSRAGYRVLFYSGVNGGLKDRIAAGQTLDFRNRSQISAPSHTFEFVGSGTNYNALPWNGGVPIPANAIVQTNNGRVYSSNTNEKGDFAVGSQFAVDGTTGSVTINTDQFNLSGLNFIGPFSRNGGISTVGVQLREVSNNTSLLSDTGGTDGNTAPTQFAVRTYADNRFLAGLTATAGSPLTITDTSSQDAQGFWTRTRNIALSMNVANGLVRLGANGLVPGELLPSGGSVTSVALTLPAGLFTVSGSPVTTNGTLAGSLTTQSANAVFAGPTSGSAAAPAFRALVATDLPSHTHTAEQASALPATFTPQVVTSYDGGNLDMAALAGKYGTVTVTNTYTLTTSNRAEGRTFTLLLIAGGTAPHNLVFPAAWVFLGVKPSSIVNGKRAILTITFYGTTDADCIAAYAVQQ